MSEQTYSLGAALLNLGTVIGLGLAWLALRSGDGFMVGLAAGFVAANLLARLVVWYYRPAARLPLPSPGHRDRRH